MRRRITVLWFGTIVSLTGAIVALGVCYTEADIGAFYHTGPMAEEHGRYALWALETTIALVLLTVGLALVLLMSYRTRRRQHKEMNGAEIKRS